MKLALIDLDGVAADDTHRVPFAIAKQWSDYFDLDRMASDGAWPQAKDLIFNLEQEGWTIAYLTGRRSAMRAVTEAWLSSHGFPWGRVMMREPVWHHEGLLMETPVWPEARLADFKVNAILDLLRSEQISDVVLFDDDPEVVRTIQEEVGASHAVLCTWSVKPEAMVTLAKA